MWFFFWCLRPAKTCPKKAQDRRLPLAKARVLQRHVSVLYLNLFHTAPWVLKQPMSVILVFNDSVWEPSRRPSGGHCGSVQLRHTDPLLYRPHPYPLALVHFSALFLVNYGFTRLAWLKKLRGGGRLWGWALWPSFPTLCWWTSAINNKCAFIVDQPRHSLLVRNVWSMTRLCC